MSVPIRFLRALAGLVGFVGVLLSFTHGPTSVIPSLGLRLVRFFSFFTILTNIALALALLIPAFFGKHTMGRLFFHRTLQLALTTAILIVGTVYQSLLLFDLWTRTGLSLVASLICHYVMPTLALIIWVVDPPCVYLGWRSLASSLAFPLVYLCWVMLQGAVTGWYPYPFLDLPSSGSGAVLRTISLLALGFLFAGAALIFIQRLRLKRLF